MITMGWQYDASEKRHGGGALGARILLFDIRTDSEAYLIPPFQNQYLCLQASSKEILGVVARHS
jgi:hypothetical protein